MKHDPVLYCGLALAFIVGWSVIVPPSRAISTITVTTTNDVIASDGLCTLREAIIAANTDSAFSDCPGNSGGDTIDFSPSLPVPATFALTHTGANEDGAMTGDLDIVGTLTINGTGLDDIIIDGNGTDRVLEIRPGAHVTITGVTIRNGNPGAAADGGGAKVLGALTLSNSTIDANQGGGIRNDGGLLILNGVQVRNNAGHGIRNENGGTLSFTDGLVSGHQGGGIYSRSSYVTLSSVAVISNTGGGGVFNIGLGTNPAWLTMNACSVMSNTATNGGGIFSEGLGARATINNTDISGNTATSAGGGVYNNGLMTLNGSTLRHNQARSGGGIDHLGTSLTMMNDTIGGNTATDNGGGLYNRGTALLTNLTFSGNSTGDPDTGGNIFNQEASLSIVNTIVALAGGGGNCFNSDGFINSLGHNLEDANTCSFVATGDITNTNPLLGPLQDNGGATPTHALLLGSPAIDQGDDARCPATDQRGVTRPQGAACDIGAYEFGDTADLSIGKKRQGRGAVAAGGRITYTITITNAGPTTPVSATVVDTWTPTDAVVGVDAPDCAVNLEGGVITCTGTNLGTGSALLPDPHVVFTTSTTFSGKLTNTASISTVGGISDINLTNNVSDPIVVTITRSGDRLIYLPLVLK